MFMFGSGAVAGWKFCQSVALKFAQEKSDEQNERIKQLEGTVEKLYERLLDGGK